MSYQSKLDRLHNQQLKQPNVQQYLQTRKIFDDIYNVLDSSWNINDDRRVERIIELSKYPKMTFNHDDKHEEQVYCEINVYPQMKSVKSQTQYFKKRRLLKTSKHKEMLDAMIQSTYGWYVIIDRNDIKSQTTLENVFTHKRIILTDMNLGALGVGKKTYLFLHIIHYNDIYFQTGMAMYFVQNDENKKWLKQNADVFTKSYNVNQLLLVENHYRNHEKNEIELKDVVKKYM
ncbi:MAG: hypothetical protein LUG46_02595 [Erysipelotrichaceae bacterium]|nr:hypothetical protein [Erysipelotrichaceae bacterium]